MEKEDSHAVENLYESYYFAPEIKTDEKNCLIPNKLSGACSEFKNFIKSNKIPEYAREYKREYQFIRGINKELEYIIDFMIDYDKEFKSYKLDKIMRSIKGFLRAQEKGKLKDVSNFKFNDDDIYNIIELKKSLPEYYCFIQNFYDWERANADDEEDDNKKTTVSRYQIYKYDLELFLSKLNIEIVYSDNDSDYDSDSENLDFSYTDSDMEDFGKIIYNLVKNSSSESESESDSD